jgi:hypothetical protein
VALQDGKMKVYARMKETLYSTQEKKEWKMPSRYGKSLTASTLAGL